MDKKSIKTAVITGGSDGIGLALVKVLILQGYNVIATSRSGEIEGLVSENLKVLPLELGNTEEFAALTQQILCYTNEIDLLINNAGVALDIGSEKLGLEDFNRTIEVNLTGLIFFCEQLVPFISRGGKILNISSAMGLLSQADINGPSYRISKAGVNMYTKILAMKLAANSISVNAVHPGWVRTKLGGGSAPLSTEESAQAIWEFISAGTGTGRFAFADTGECMDL